MPPRIQPNEFAGLTTAATSRSVTEPRNTRTQGRPATSPSQAAAIGSSTATSTNSGRSRTGPG